MLVPLAFVSGLMVGTAAATGTGADRDRAATSEAVVESSAASSRQSDDQGDVGGESFATSTTTSTTSAATPDRGTRAAPLSIGEVATVGDYDVAVIGFTADATSEVLGANMFNDPPPAGEVYALVRLRATYHGDEQGLAGFELTAGYIGGDGRVYVDHDCGAVEPDNLMDQPEVVAGGTVEGNMCLRLPAAVLGSGALFVEPLFSFDDAKVWWAES